MRVDPRGWQRTVLLVFVPFFVTVGIEFLCKSKADWVAVAAIGGGTGAGLIVMLTRGDRLI